jgi:probable HAF family extracellular repeat protein
MKTLKNRALCALGIAVINSLGLLSTVEAQSLTWLGTLGGETSVAYGVTDSAVVVGWSDSGVSPYLPFRWENGVMVSLGTLGGDAGAALAISWSGNVVVGGAFTSSPFRYRPFRWENGTMQNLGTLGGDRYSYATSVSGNGRVVVGFAPDDNESLRAFRWEDGVMTQLTTDGAKSVANDVAESGSAIVGTVYDHDGNGIAFLWDSGSLIYFMGTGCCSNAEAISGRGGNRIAGVYTVNNQSHAFYWYNGTLQDIGPDFVPRRMSADGVIVGKHSVLPKAYRWTSDTGLQDLNEVYASLLTDGSNLQEANAISPDGRYIVGKGYNSASELEEAYLLDTGPRCTPNTGDVDDSGVVDDADLLAVLFVFGSTGDDLGRADVNCDNQIDDADLLIVLFNFGSCPGC